MGRRGIRVVLVVLLLGMALASVSVPGVVAEDASQRADVFEDLQLNGFGSSGIQAIDGNVKHLAPRDPSRTLSLDALQVYEGEGRNPQIVIGPDSRVEITDTTVYPYSAVAQLIGYDESLPSGFVSTCTATFVGPNVLLTAAHCLWHTEDFGGWIDEVEIIPGASGDNAPFGVVGAQSLWIPEQYPSDEEAGTPWDYALITVADTSIEETVGSLSLGVLTTSELQAGDFNATTSGYPGDKPDFTQWLGSEPGFTEVNDDWLVHEIDSFQGQSGSAVWRESDLAVVGVESWEDNALNYAVRLDIPIMYDLMNACQELDCKLNHFLTDIPGDGAAYDRVWERTDLPVASGAQPRTWMWGPEPITKVRFEPYTEAPNGFRTVLYQEKSRMEITDPNSDPNSIWYVTNGLATLELMTGNLQLGNNTFEQHEPAEINVAGDGDDPDGPTYVTFAGLRDDPPHAEGSTITATVDRAGNVGTDPALATHGVTAAHLVPETGHFVASIFWEFMNSSGTVWQDGQFVQAPLFDNAYFATGFPLTEAYWAVVRVGGTDRTVLVQAFERRVLTYTPGNPAGFEVEAGNVGIHYLSWYEQVTHPESTGPGGEPPPGSGNPAPEIGELLAVADLPNWPEVETNNGDTGAPYEDGYRVRNPPAGFLQLVAEGTFGDAFYTVETRAAQPSAVGGASCIIYRADPNDENPLFLDSGYWFCLFYEGPNVIAAVTIYETSVDVVELGGAEFQEPLPAASEWHQIGVVAQGSEFWFVYDGVVLGSQVHDVGPGSGQVGILSFNFDESEGGPNAIYDYRNLEIYGLANGSTPPPPPPGGDSPPAEGEIVHQSSLGDVPAQDSSDGASGAPTASGTAYRIVGPPQSGLALIDNSSYGDGSYSLDIYSAADSGNTSGCLILRATASGDYNMCIAYGGGSAVGALSFYLDLAGGTGVDLGSFPFQSPSAAEQALTVKVITQGANFWFYVDGQLVGSASHGSGPSGGVGFSMVCVDEELACEVGFTNLVVRSLAS